MELIKDDHALFTILMNGTNAEDLSRMQVNRDETLAVGVPRVLYI